MFSCDDVLSELAGYSDGEVSDSLRKEVEERIRHCRSCRAVYDPSHKTLRIVTDCGVLELPENVSVRVAAGISSKVSAEDEYEHLLVALIERLGRGDTEALGEFYDKTSRLVYALVHRIVGDPASAEEVTCDVYTQVWREALRYSRERGAPAAWLIMIARSRAIDCVRSRARCIGAELQLDSVCDATDASPNPEENSAIASRRRFVQSVLVSLPQEERELIDLAFYSGLTHREIAGRTGLPLGTVKWRLRQGMVRLRDQLRPLMGEL